MAICASSENYFSFISFEVFYPFFRLVLCQLFSNDFSNALPTVVREERGPYSDPQHPYFYEEEDVWMAPGFINQFYEVG